MNMQSGGRKRLAPQDEFSFGHEPDILRSPSQSAPSSAESEMGDTQPRFAAGGVHFPPKDFTPSGPAQGNFASIHADPAMPGLNQARTDHPYHGPSEPRLNNSGRPSGNQHPESHSENLKAYCAPDPAFSPHQFAPGSATAEDEPVSPLHVALITIILLAGLAIGIGRWWWIDEKLDAASAKTPAVAALPAGKNLDEPSSIQSSIDRAYIPSLVEELDAPMEKKSTDASSDPALAQETPAARNDSEQGAESAPSDPSQVTANLNAPPKAIEDSREAKPAASPTARFEASQGNQRQARKETASTKPAKATKKDRTDEIDRVRAQAYSETSDDRIGKRKPSSSRESIGPQSERRSGYRTKRVAQSTVTGAQYARCERISHIIRREQCKWKLCNNKWGKGACPSFRREKPSIY